MVGSAGPTFGLPGPLGSLSPLSRIPTLYYRASSAPLTSSRRFSQNTMTLLPVVAASLWRLVSRASGMHLTLLLGVRLLQGLLRLSAPTPPPQRQLRALPFARMFLLSLTMAEARRYWSM